MYSLNTTQTVCNIAILFTFLYERFIHMLNIKASLSFWKDDLDVWYTQYFLLLLFTFFILLEVVSRSLFCLRMCNLYLIRWRRLRLLSSQFLITFCIPDWAFFCSTDSIFCCNTYSERKLQRRDGDNVAALEML